MITWVNNNTNIIIIVIQYSLEGMLDSNLLRIKKDNVNNQIQKKRLQKWKRLNYIFNFYMPYTIPVKPINAKAKIPAITNAIGTPFIPLGASIRSICSLKPANKTMANPKPTADAIA